MRQHVLDMNVQFPIGNGASSAKPTQIQRSGSDYLPYGFILTAAGDLQPTSMDRLPRDDFHPLLSLELFTAHIRPDLTPREQAVLSYKRAKKLVHAFGLTRSDIEELTPKFWRMNIDPMLLFDGAATTLLTIQLNLVVGTIASYARNQPYLTSLLEKLLRFDICGQFCLTEVDHGLDALNLETTATLLPDGGFMLHTPHPGASKCMPPTVPCGLPCIGVVFAKLMDDNKSKGVFPFIVSLNDGISMSHGVTARLLPYRGGTNPVNHSITTFDNVYLPPTAILRHREAPDDNLRAGFLRAIRRVAVGSLSLAATAIPIMQASACIAARYSQRRTAAGPEGRVPLITFTTSHMPVLMTLSRSFVLNAFYKYATDIFCDEAIDFRVRHGVAAAMKVVAIQHAQEGNLELSERCGHQGLFGHNQISIWHAEMRGIAIAEGDLLGLSIRLSSELLLGRYEMPISTHPESPLAQHEVALLAESRAIIFSMTHHRGDEFNRFILPRCQAIVESIGLRMAYDAALDASLDQSITDIYLAAAIKRDPIWYSENLGFTRAHQAEAEERVYRAALPLLEAWLDRANMDDYVTAPIVSAEKWAQFSSNLKTFSPPEFNIVDPGLVRSHL